MLLLTHRLPECARARVVRVWCVCGARVVRVWCACGARVVQPHTPAPLTPPHPCTPPPQDSLSAAARAAISGLSTLLDAEVYTLLEQQAMHLERKRLADIEGMKTQLQQYKTRCDELRRKAERAGEECASKVAEARLACEEASEAAIKALEREVRRSSKAMHASTRAREARRPRVKRNARA